jgi:hypothetical protein
VNKEARQEVPAGPFAFLPSKLNAPRYDAASLYGSSPDIGGRGSSGSGRVIGG